MPMVDYREWYRQEQERRRRAGMPGAVGAPGSTYQGYKAPSTGDILKQQGTDIAQTGIQAGVGYATGGPVGAAIAAIPGVVNIATNSVRGFKDASEAGDYGTAMKQIAPLGGTAFTAAGAYAPWAMPLIAPGLAIASALLRKPQTRVEEARWKKLKQAGFDIPKWVEEGQDIKDPNAWYNKDLAPDFIGNAPETGQWTNNKFAMSRDTADLRPEDIWGYADNAETFGKNWMDGSEDARRQIMQMALDNHLVKEGKGTVDINWTPELLDQAQTILGDSVAQNPKNQGRKRWVPPTNKWTPP